MPPPTSSPSSPYTGPYPDADQTGKKVYEEWQRTGVRSTTLSRVRRTAHTFIDTTSTQPFSLSSSQFSNLGRNDKTALQQFLAYALRTQPLGTERIVDTKLRNTLHAYNEQQANFAARGRLRQGTNYCKKGYPDADKAEKEVYEAWKRTKEVPAYVCAVQRVAQETSPTPLFSLSMARLSTLQMPFDKIAVKAFLAYALLTQPPDQERIVDTAVRTFIRSSLIKAKEKDGKITHEDEQPAESSVGIQSTSDLTNVRLNTYEQRDAAGPSSLHSAKRQQSIIPTNPSSNPYSLSDGGQDPRAAASQELLEAAFKQKDISSRYYENMLANNPELTEYVASFFALPFWNTPSLVSDDMRSHRHAYDNASAAIAERSQFNKIYESFPFYRTPFSPDASSSSQPGPSQTTNYTSSGQGYGSSMNVSASSDLELAPAQTISHAGGAFGPPGGNPPALKAKKGFLFPCVTENKDHFFLEGTNVDWNYAVAVSEEEMPDKYAFILQMGNQCKKLKDVNGWGGLPVEWAPGEQAVIAPGFLASLWRSARGTYGPSSSSEPGRTPHRGR